MKYIIIPLVIAVCAVLIFNHSVEIVTAGGTYRLFVDIADTPDQRAKGLMDREDLQEWKGMLFIYDEDAIPDFWMKNMLISLDIIFIDADNVIQHIAKDVPPCEPDTKCALYSPDTPIRYVLEVKAGYTEKYSVAIGDKVIFGN